MIKLKEAIQAGQIVCHLTEPKDIISILGEASRSNSDNDDAIQRLVLYYPNAEIHFSRFRIYEDDPFVLRSIIIRGAKVNVTGMGPPSLKNVRDLQKLKNLHDVSLKNLDLSEQGDLLERLNFDTTTIWPPPDRLPAGFIPQKLLRDGMNPGLSIRTLHDKRINGREIGIAILDQRLLIGHEEYASRIIKYDATRANSFEPQFHASPIVGIAVGKSCGVAPGSFVFYYALPRTDMPDNKVFCDIIDEIIAYNNTSDRNEQIRVISISSGSFSEGKNYELWKATLKKAQDAGILVVTCSDRFLEYGTLKLQIGENPDDPNSYVRNKYGGGNNTLKIPTGNKTIASYRGVDVYAFERGDGKSWAAPYIAGLAALAFQVNPNLKPKTIVEQLVKTAIRTNVGPVVNPCAFIDSLPCLYQKTDIIFEDNLLGIWKSEMFTLSILKGNRQTEYKVTVSKSNERNDSTDIQNIASLIQVKGEKFLSVFPIDHLPADAATSTSFILPDIIFHVVQTEPQLVLQVMHYHNFAAFLKESTDSFLIEKFVSQSTFKFKKEP